MKRVHSFDVFDTCLTRRVAAPSDVFFAVAEKVAARLGLAPGRAWVEDFVAARSNCEHQARRQSAREDITLAEIWRGLAKAMGWPADPGLPELELEAEAEAIVPVASLRQEVRDARAAGARIIFVSDMYLPAAFIQAQLLKHGYAREEDHLYVSSEIGKLKSTGNLFRYILKEENIDPSDLMHVGDHAHSDVAAPRQLGIVARLVNEAGLSRAEKAVAASDPAANHLAGAMRAFRVGKTARQDPVSEVVSQFIGPFALGLAAWALRRAREDGVKRLYFLSRDGQLPWIAAGAIAPQFGGIECRYLAISRQALFLPSVEDISPAGLPWLKLSLQRPTLRSFLAKLDLEFADVEPMLGDAAGAARGEYAIDSEEKWAMFWKAIGDARIQTKISRTIALRRERARHYFEAEGLFDDVPWALVDLGWLLTCQHALQKLLRIWGHKITARGYYFGLKKDRLAPAESGLAEGLFYQPPGDSFGHAAAREIFQNHPTLLEHIIGCADHPSVHHYDMVDGKPGPVFAAAMDPSALRYVQDVHASVLEFATENKHLADVFRDNEGCQRIFGALVSEFFKHPSRASVLALKDLTISTDQNGLYSMPLVRPVPLRLALLSLLPNFLVSPGKKIRSLWWPEGSLAISPPAIRRIVGWAESWGRIRHRLRRLLSR